MVLQPETQFSDFHALNVLMSPGISAGTMDSASRLLTEQDDNAVESAQNGIDRVQLGQYGRNRLEDEKVLDVATPDFIQLSDYTFWCW
jgi:hypothetical protein